MIPMSSSSSHNQRKPPSRRQSAARSKSFLGTIKNLVTAPLGWFAAGDTNGKRRRLPQSHSNDDLAEDNSVRNKRMRVNSPDRHVGSSYLDPPEAIFRSSQLQPSVPGDLPHRSSSVFTPSSTLPRPPHNRRSFSPLISASNSRPSGISRTMSLDPPPKQRLTRDASMVLIPRDVSMDASSFRNSMSIAPDVSLPPAGSPIRMRTSLTPQPTGSNLGLSLSSRARDPSEPPPVTSLRSNPVFVRAPSETQQQRSMSAQPTVTLGSIVDSQRSTHSPVRHHSALLFPQAGSTSHVSDGYRPVNAAEKALHELDVYKTPLLPTRLKTASALPDIFKPKKSHNLILMHERDDKTRLGVPGKRRSKKIEVNRTKPYAGEGGMKKLLARRKMEEEEEKVAVMDGSGEKTEGQKRELSTRRHARGREAVPESNRDRKEEIQHLPPPVLVSRSNVATGREQSSLRVGRSKSSRTHIVRPHAKPLNRFSARYADEEGDDLMQEDDGKNKDQLILEEAAKNVPVFDIPVGFSFAKEATPIEHDLGNAKEPPMVTLPFSFAKPNTATDVSLPVQPSTKESEQLNKSPSFGPANVTATDSNSNATPPFRTSLLAPSIALVPPTPEAPQAATTPTPPSSDLLNNGSAENAVPNFFAKSSVFSDPSVSAIPSSLGSLVPPAPVNDTENPFWDGEKDAEPFNKANKSDSQSANLFRTEPKPSAFAGSDKPPSILLFGPPDSEKNTSVFGVGLPSSTPLFGSSAASEAGLRAEATTAASSFGGVPKRVDSTPPAFSFAAPAKVPDVPIPIRPLFTFGAPKVKTSKEPEPIVMAAPEVSIPSPLFGSSSAPTAPFGAISEPVIAVVKPSEPSTAFSQQTLPTAPTPSTLQEPSTLVSPSGGFIFGQPPSATEDSGKPKNPFSFGAAPSTPPAVMDKKPLFGFGIPGASGSTPGISLGAPTGSSSGSDVSSKPFTFGVTSTPTIRPVTPPKNEDQDLRMEESPTRDMQLNGNGKQNTELRPSLFSFNTPGDSAGSSFGQIHQSNSTAFSFNTPATNSFVSKAESVTDQKPGMTFAGFGQSQTSSSGFVFGQQAPQTEQPRPSTTGSFSFQTTPTATTGPSFTFAPPTTNPFVQTTSQGGSAPNSPSTFKQPSPFSFNAPAPAPATAFSFGTSQPSSPATTGSVVLPSSTPSGFSFGAGTATQPTSQFSAPAAPSPGGTLFTIGSAPPAPAGGRQVKRLPVRRGGKRNP